MKSLKEISKSQWIKFSIVAILYLLFTIWVGNYWLLFGLFLIADIYLTKFIPWGAWKESKNKSVKKVMEWVDAIVFALVAVYFINLFIFQNYKIPSSSLEKSLLVGDFLFVSKLSFGPRIPNTPLSFPLAQHTLPVLNCKSYIDWPQWDYKRLKGFGHVKRNDIVVFNFPAGDTVALNMQDRDYYSLCYEAGFGGGNGREIVRSNKIKYGDIVYRPVDRRENYVKRCIGMPGDSLHIINNAVYINEERMRDPENMQFNYYVETDGVLFSEQQFDLLNISKEDRFLINAMDEDHATYYLRWSGIQPTFRADGRYNPIYRFPLTKSALETLNRFKFVKTVKIEQDFIEGDSYYPVGYHTGWNRDNYGPIWIPKKGATIVLNRQNLALYSRCIENYEGNALKVSGERIFLNGIEANSYTFKYDYYFMMGDNRHNSADSRSWGFVPEDHVVGQPILVWLSLEKDKSLFKGGIRWNRIFKMVNKI